MNVLKGLLIVTLSSGLLWACSNEPETPDAASVFAGAIAAIGGEDAILAVDSLLIEGAGSEALIGQMRNPNEEADAWTVSDAIYQYDLNNQRMHVVYTRTAEFAWPLPRVNQQEYGVDGNLAYTVTPNGAARQSTAQSAQTRQLLRHHPLLLLRLGLEPASRINNLREEGENYAIDITTADGDLLTLIVDKSTMMPGAIESPTSDLNLGDVVVETRFSDYENVGGLSLPTRFTSTLDRFNRSTFTVSTQRLNTGVGNLAASPELQAAPVPSDIPTANVVVEELGAGLWRLAGQGHHSIVVEFADHLTLIEAPTNEQRTLAVIAEARRLAPEKPLTQVVVTHHHFDHTGGLRAAIAEGLTIITHRDNEALFRELANRPHIIPPDVLALNPRPLNLMLVGNELSFSDSVNEMQLYHIEGNEHATTLLMAYFPAEQLLVQADVFGSGNVSFPYAANLAQNIEANGLVVERHVPIHGNPLTREDFERVLAENP